MRPRRNVRVQLLPNATRRHKAMPHYSIARRISRTFTTQHSEQEPSIINEPNVTQKREKAGERGQSAREVTRSTATSSQRRATQSARIATPTATCHGEPPRNPNRQPEERNEAGCKRRRVPCQRAKRREQSTRKAAAAIPVRSSCATP